MEADAVSVLVGTEDGLAVLDGSERRELEGRPVTALAADGSDWWVLLDGATVARCRGGSWREVASAGDERLGCLLPIGDDVLVGAYGPRLFRLSGDERLESVTGFDHIEGSDEWYQPFDAPPALRSLARSKDALLANVHVGGIPRSVDGGRLWQPTIDVHADVHQVRAHADRAGVVCAAAAVGLARSDDAGATWTLTHEGLHATYLRAVAFAGDTVLVSASDGPHGAQSAIYRRPLDGDVPFERSGDGLPEWLAGNIDTFCLDATGTTAVFGDREGTVFASTDAGGSWLVLATGLAPVTAVVLA